MGLRNRSHRPERTSPRQFEPLSDTPLAEGRQAPALPLVSSGWILLLNFESPYRESRALTLRALGHKVFVPEEHGTSLWDITDKDLQAVDLVRCDVTSVKYDAWRELRRICRFRKHDGMPIRAECSSRKDHGAAFERLVETDLETRLVYAK